MFRQLGTKLWGRRVQSLSSLSFLPHIGSSAVPLMAGYTTDDGKVFGCRTELEMLPINDLALLHD